jgi:hypothetical protein
MARTQKAKKSKTNVKTNPGLDKFLDDQKKLTEDYVGKPRGKRATKSCAYTLVRGPNDELLLVSKKQVIQIKDQDQFFEDLNQLVSDYLGKHIGRFVNGPGVHVGTAKIFPK